MLPSLVLEWVLLHPMGLVCDYYTVVFDDLRSDTIIWCDKIKGWLFPRNEAVIPENFLNFFTPQKMHERCSFRLVVGMF